MQQPTQTPPDAGAPYKPCRRCRRCTSGVPLGGIPSPDDCYAIYLDRTTEALGIREPEATQ